MSDIEKLQHVEKLNQDWQIYNEQREAFVVDLTRRYHSATNELRAKNEEICRSEALKMKNNVRIQQLEVENMKMKSELNELKTCEQKLERISTLYAVTKNKNSDLENDLNCINIKLAKLEAVNEKLLRSIRKDRYVSTRKDTNINFLFCRRRSEMITSAEALQIDRSISQLTEKIDKLSNSGSSDTFTSLPFCPPERSPS